MIVNVRRGSNGYGRLCVVQKKIELNPQMEKFGLKEDTPQCDLYVTRVFTSCSPLTADKAKEFLRTDFSRASDVVKNKNLTLDEKNLVSIFQTFNNKAIDCMKDQAYRQVMLGYWAQHSDKQIEFLQKGGSDSWKMVTMKALLTTILHTGSNIFFQRLPCKVACYERYHRFLEIMKHYRYFFVESKCMADEDFVAQYQKQKLAESVSAQSFDGMWPELQQKSASGKLDAGAYTRQHHTRPKFGNHQADPKQPSGRSSASDESNGSGDSGNSLAPTLSKNLRTAEQVEEREKQVDAILESNFPSTNDEKPSQQVYLNFVEANFTTPIGKDYADKHMSKFTNARWGQEEESFTERLAKIQDW